MIWNGGLADGGLLGTAVAGVWYSVHPQERIRFYCYRANWRRNLGCGPELVRKKSHVPELNKLDVNKMGTDVCRKPVEEQKLEQETRFVSIRK